MGYTAMQGYPDYLIRIVLNGFQNTEDYIVIMPPQASFSDDQLAAILTYLRQLPGNNADAILPERVRTIREESAGRNRIWSPEELESLVE